MLTVKYSNLFKKDFKLMPKQKWAKGKNMINEVITEILQAESKAEQIVAEANARALEISEQSGDECSKILAEAQERGKATRQAIKEDSEKMAECAYNEIINAQQAECDKLRAEKQEKISQAGEYIFRSILNGNC